MNSTIERVAHDLRLLTPEKQEQVAHYVHLLKEQSLVERNKILAEVFNTDLTSGEIDEWESAMQTCQKIDVESW